MYNNKTQGNNHKVAGTQEMITAQNSRYQSKKNFDGTKELFNAIDENELVKVWGNYDFGIVKPEYIVTNLKMSERLIDRARIPEDQKAVLRNSFGFLLGALQASHRENLYGPWEHTAEEYYPDDLRVALDNAETEEEREELFKSGLVEITNILGDFLNDKGEYIVGSWEDGKLVIEDYIDVLEENSFEVPDYIYDDMNRISEEF